jgi:large subunit ribosomal protein L1
MTKRSKRCKEFDKVVDKNKAHTLKEALTILQKTEQVKFNESVDISVKLGVNPKKSDQQVRGTISLPHGTGKDINVVVLTKGEHMKAAEKAGANVVGNDDLVEKIKGGWTSFDVLIVTPDMMREVGKLGKILGPRGLMPTPKAGTVTTDVAKAVQETKAGKIEYKVDKNCVINGMIGKISFTAEQLEENFMTLLGAIARARPSSAKGQYMRALSVSSTMGPGLKIDTQSLSLS